MSRSYRHSPGISEGSEKWDKRQMNKAIRADMRSQLDRVAKDTLDGYNVTLLRNKLARSLWDMRKDGHNVSFGSFRIVVNVKREHAIHNLDRNYIETVGRRTYAIQLPFCSCWCKEDNHKSLWRKTNSTWKWCETNIGFGK